MYIHLGQDTAVRLQSIVGIFDIDNTSVSAATKEFFAKCGADGVVVNVINHDDPLEVEIPKSFVVCREDGKTTVYITQISPATLRKRAGMENPLEKWQI